MRVKAKKLTDKDRIETLDALYTAATAMRGRDAVKLFLRDLLTEDEQVMLGRRILIAQQLLTGATYDAIALKMHVGHDTIQRVHRWLRDELPGYEQAIQGIERELGKRAARAESRKNWANLKSKYPLHFLLFR
ncbi:hypothetical protein A2841_03785 [Candidatus Kaiserbacteria bacterium RIFCSPHIGHO2_01_FULL_48_10]|uniref:TrpR like protein, YerC/YecD n=1 Tax=Candidatus Kaiserbacteria bacterium RIFCSPHIGHO2_01_FULL_48_10 TaxID=1798476 RepID=A0A1F6C4B7_9BACT|nr:MAG: hypothetical protein A2841_03785 [Candidatus Kaiserbacteria bacterium RIFCSPHIGHO2_01_FULL_48_10]